MNTDIAKILEEHGHKVTSQRVALAQIMFARPQHLSADALLELARAAGVRVSKATVYNTLNLFAECGVVREVNVDGSRIYYDSTTHPHHHLFNMDTGELTDLPEDSVRLAELPPLPEDTEAVGVDVIVKVRSRRD
ncbi:MAG: Fur family transcriptional regulator [Gammaproteobacteria bacterium]|jgi:Fur family iron response transcriptional regulator|nr:MAG: Fur family transcriptional regulator [Gammaproteobacteria bacterium SG8_31]